MCCELQLDEPLFVGSENPRLVRQALEYASLGLRVIPLGERSKSPKIGRWPERASSNPKQIRSWFKRWPDANIGLLMGNGLVAIDIDPDREGVNSFRKLLRGRRLPFTAVANTGSDGWHYLFRYNPSLRVGNMVDLLPGIDVRGDDGQVVVEPSIHPVTGKRYQWIYCPCQGIAKAPKWLVRLLTERVSAKHPSKSVMVRSDISFAKLGDEARLTQEIIVGFPVHGFGQRNDQMVRAVGSLLGRGFDPRLTLRIVTNWWEHFYGEGTIGTPPTEAEAAVGATINSTMRNPKFKQAKGMDHRARCKQIKLDDHQTRMIEHGGIVSDGLSLLSPTSNRVTHGNMLCKTSNERAFVEALVVYFTYKLQVAREAVLKATRDQLNWIIKDRHDIDLDNRQFERLKSRFITRTGKPANRYELAVQTLKGRQGVPSEFELTGLKGLLASEISFPSATSTPRPSG